MTNESLNNIMVMCINAIAYTGTKTLQYIGLISSQTTKCQSLSNYQAFLDARLDNGILKYKESRQMNMEDLIKIREEMAHLEERLKSNTKRIDHLEIRYEKTEQVVTEMDKSLSISMEQIKTIAEDLKQTSINFKEAVMRSSNAQSKDTEALKEKCHELDQKIEKVNARLEKETVVKDAESWRNSKKQIWSWVLNGILGLIAAALGLSHLF